MKNKKSDNNLINDLISDCIQELNKNVESIFAVDSPITKVVKNKKSYEDKDEIINDDIKKILGELGISSD